MVFAGNLDPFRVYGETFYLTYAAGVCAVQSIIYKDIQIFSRGLDSSGSYLFRFASKQEERNAPSVK